MSTGGRKEGSARKEGSGWDLESDRDCNPDSHWRASQEALVHEPWSLHLSNGYM